MGSIRVDSYSKVLTIIQRAWGRKLEEVEYFPISYINKYSHFATISLSLNPIAFTLSSNKNQEIM